MELLVPPEFTLSYLTRPRRDASTVEEDVRRALAGWGGRLTPTTKAPVDCKGTWLSIAQVEPTWWVVATNAPLRDALAAALARRRRRSALFLDPFWEYEVRYGPQTPPSRYHHEVRASSSLEVRQASTFLVTGRLRVAETPRHAALHALARCERGHRNELDLTRRVPSFAEGEAEVPADDLAPPSFAVDPREAPSGWFRLTLARRATQRVLWVTRCTRCRSPIHASLTWDGTLRAVRALRRRPSLRAFDAAFDPLELDDRIATRAAELRETKAVIGKPPRKERAKEATTSVRTFVRRASARAFMAQLLTAQAANRKSEAKALVDELFRMLKAPRPNPQLSLLSVLDYQGPLATDQALAVAMECLRRGFASSAERFFELAAPISPEAASMLRKELETNPLRPSSDLRDPAALFDALLRRFSRR